MSISPDSIPTVKVVAPKVKGNMLGFIEINLSDFNKEIHTLYEETVEVVEKIIDKVEDKPATPPAATQPEANWGAPPPATPPAA